MYAYDNSLASALKMTGRNYYSRVFLFTVEPLLSYTGGGSSVFNKRKRPRETIFSRLTKYDVEFIIYNERDLETNASINDKMHLSNLYVL